MRSPNDKRLLSAFKRLEKGFTKDALDLGSELLKSQSLGDQAEGHMCCGTAYEQGGMTSRSISTRRSVAIGYSHLWRRAPLPIVILHAHA